MNWLYYMVMSQRQKKGFEASKQHKLNSALIVPSKH